MTLYPKSNLDETEKEDNTLPIYQSPLYSDAYYTSQNLEEMYNKWVGAQAPKESVTLQTYPQLTNVVNTSIPNIPISSITWKNNYNITSSLNSYDTTIQVKLDDGSLESVTREELIKYISERKLIQENEAVRSMYERYQVAVKLVRSDDNGDTGV